MLAQLVMARASEYQQLNCMDYTVPSECDRLDLQGYIYKVYHGIWHKYLISMLAWSRSMRGRESRATFSERQYNINTKHFGYSMMLIIMVWVLREPVLLGFLPDNLLNIIRGSSTRMLVNPPSKRFLKQNLLEPANSLTMLGKLPARTRSFSFLDHHAAVKTR